MIELQLINNTSKKK